jgi:hypothetical protein
MTTDIVLEIEGSDQLTLPYELMSQGGLLRIAQQLAAERDVPLSEVNMRFIDRFEVALWQLPAENMTEPGDADFAEFAATGGCRTCGSGIPCRELIRSDIEKILAVDALKEIDPLVCLTWLQQEEMSSLTHLFGEMREGFQSWLAQHPQKPVPPVNLARMIGGKLQAPE